MYTLWIYSNDTLIAHWRVSQRALENRMRKNGCTNTVNELYRVFKIRFTVHKYATTTNKRDYSKFLHADSLLTAVETGQASNQDIRYVVAYR